MKIYFFEENIDKMGGVERIISTLANSFSSDYVVKVISLKKTRPTEFFEYKDEVERIYIDKRNYLSTWHNNKNIFKKKFYSLYYRINNLFLDSKKKKLFEEIKKEDILVFGRIQVALKWLPYLKKGSNIIIRDANHYYCNNEKEKTKIDGLLKNYAKLLIVSSDESKKVYEEVLGKNISIKKIYNPLGIIPSDLYDSSSKKIVAVGRYDNQKAFDVLLEAFSIVHSKHDDWYLEIIGTNHPDLVKLVDELKLNTSVKLIPESKDIKKALDRSSLYVMTSRYEGYANSLVEALSCGIPSVSFDWLLGVDEIIDDKNNGEIVHLHDRFKYFEGATFGEDIISLANTISNLIESPKTLDKYNKNAIKIVDSRDKDKIINCWKEEIERLKNDK